MNKELIGELMVAIPLGLFVIFCIGWVVYYNPWESLVLFVIVTYFIVAKVLMNSNGKYDGDNGWYI